MLIKKCGLLFALFFTLAGCSSPNAAQPASSPAAPPLTVPKPASAQVGTVSGRIINTKDGAKPLGNAPLYLGSVVKATDGTNAVVSLDKNAAPRADTDTEGRFVFTDVPAGTYGLMLDTPQGAILLNKPVTNEDMVLEVIGGEILDVGELSYLLDVGLY